MGLSDLGETAYARAGVASLNVPEYYVNISVALMFENISWDSRGRDTQYTRESVRIQTIAWKILSSASATTRTDRYAMRGGCVSRLNL